MTQARASPRRKHQGKEKATDSLNRRLRFKIVSLIILGICCGADSKTLRQVIKTLRANGVTVRNNEKPFLAITRSILTQQPDFKILTTIHQMIEQDINEER